MPEAAEGSPKISEEERTQEAVPAPVCLNCGAHLSGRYCSQCGQKASDLRVRLGDFFHEAVHEFLHFDGKIIRTMSLLIGRPGQLTIDFLAGKRSRHVSPLRLYLVWSAVFFFLALAFGPAKFAKEGGNMPAAVAQKPAEHSFGIRVERGAIKFVGDPQRINEVLVHDSPKAMFVLMPFFALLLFLFFRKRERFFVPHLYFSIHFHAFVFFLSACMELLARPGVTVLTVAAQAGGQLGPPIYLYLALRRFYGNSRLLTLGKMVVTGLVYLLGLSAVMLAILVYRLANS